MITVMTAEVVATPDEKLPDNFFYSTLTNGLEVLVIEDPSVPLVTIEIALKNGAFTEEYEYNGLSHLYEHMFFKANKALPSQEAFMDKVNELGIVFNGTTGDERVNYFFTLGSDKLKEGMEFMNNAIRYPLFLEEEMKNENPVVDGEFQRNESNPFFHLFQELNKNMWGEHYTRKNAIGEHDIILSATPEKMRVIQEKYYYPNNSILLVAGDVKHDDVFAEVKNYFSDWKPCNFDPFEKWPIPEFKPIVEDKYFLTIDENAQVPIIAIGYHGPDTRKDIEATYAADVFSFILGQTSSRFQQELIDGGLALQAQVSYQTCKYTGPINLFIVPNPSKVKECIAAVKEHISRFDSPDYFTDDQLETAKNLLAIQDVYSKESTSDFVHTISFWWASATIGYYTNYIDNLKKVTRDDINRYIRTYIKGKSSVTGILLSSQMKQMYGVEKFEDFTKP